MRTDPVRTYRTAERIARSASTERPGAAVHIRGVHGGWAVYVGDSLPGKPFATFTNGARV